MVSKCYFIELVEGNKYGMTPFSVENKDTPSQFPFLKWAPASAVRNSTVITPWRAAGPGGLENQRRCS